MSVYSLTELNLLKTSLHERLIAQLFNYNYVVSSACIGHVNTTY